ncbi:MAG: hypothetical protein ABWZ16_06430 [Microbacterium sp.]
MHPLMLFGLLPDSRRVSREAAERHAILAARHSRIPAVKPRIRALRLVLQH